MKFLSINGPDVSPWDMYMKNNLSEAGIETGFFDDKIAEDRKKHDAFIGMLGKYFTKIDTIDLSNSFRYDNADDIFDWFKNRYPVQSKFFSANEKKIKEYYAGRLAKEGEIVFTATTHFMHCYI